MLRSLRLNTGRLYIDLVMASSMGNIYAVFSAPGKFDPHTTGTRREAEAHLRRLQGQAAPVAPPAPVAAPPPPVVAPPRPVAAPSLRVSAPSPSVDRPPQEPQTAGSSGEDGEVRVDPSVPNAKEIEGKIRRGEPRWVYGGSGRYEYMGPLYYEYRDSFTGHHIKKDSFFDPDKSREFTQLTKAQRAKNRQRFRQVDRDVIFRPTTERSLGGYEEWIIVDTKDGSAVRGHVSEDYAWAELAKKFNALGPPDQPLPYMTQLKSALGAGIQRTLVDELTDTVKGSRYPYVKLRIYRLVSGGTKLPFELYSIKVQDDPEWGKQYYALMHKETSDDLPVAAARHDEDNDVVSRYRTRYPNSYRTKWENFLFQAERGEHRVRQQSSGYADMVRFAKTGKFYE